VEIFDHTEMAAVYRVGNSEYGGNSTDLAATSGGEGLQFGRSELGRLLAMPAGSLRNDVDFDRIETEQFRVLNEIAGVAVVTIVINRVADIVEERGVLQQLARAGGKIERLGERIEELQAQARDLAAVTITSGKTLSERLHRSAANFEGGLAAFGRELGQFEHQAFAQRPSTSHQFGFTDAA